MAHKQCKAWQYVESSSPSATSSKATSSCFVKGRSDLWQARTIFVFSFSYACLVRTTFMYHGNFDTDKSLELIFVSVYFLFLFLQFFLRVFENESMLALKLLSTPVFWISWCAPILCIHWGLFLRWLYRISFLLAVTHLIIFPQLK